MSLWTRSRAWLAMLAAGGAMCCAATSKAQFSIPPNDLCSGAIPLTLNTPFVGNATNATATNDGPNSVCQGTSGFRGVWFTFTPATSGRYQISANNTIFDSILEVYSAVDCVTYFPAAFTRIAGGCNDDAGAGGPGPGGTGASTSSLISNVQLNAGTTYYIKLSGFSATGWYIIDVVNFAGTGAGACCGTNGTCLLTSAYACTGQENPTMFMGVGSACSPNPCLGACCNNITGACTLTPPIGTTGCGASGIPGVWNGFGTTCAAGQCDIGACCTTGGACSLTFRESCQSTSAWAGSGTTCVPATVCNNGTLGVCCNLTTFACTANGPACPSGTAFAGFGSTCGTNPCAVGSCCTSGLACSRTFTANCTGSSKFLPSSASCSPTPCSAACCDTSGSGTCVTTSGAGCPTGYTLMQVGTTCAPNPCSFGACCSTTGGCSLAVASNCAGNNFFAGVNTTCTPDNVCNFYLGTCCSSGGTCSVTTQIGCTGTGMFQGIGVNNTGTACTSATFCQSPSIMGACCSSSGSCSATTFLGCQGSSTWMGAGIGYTSGTACSSTTFCQNSATLGTCCSSSGTCSITTVLGCTGTSTFRGLGSNYSGTGTACQSTTYCTTDSGTAIIGACCSATGGCTVTTFSGCNTLSGNFQTSTFLGIGNGITGTACNSPNPCQNSTLMGACCSTSGACTITTRNGCVATATSVFQGEGVNYSGSGTACFVTTYCDRSDYLGACCSTTGTCTLTSPSGCLFPSTYQGVGNGFNSAVSLTACTPTSYCQSTSIMGSCCSSSGTCSITTPNGCLGTSVFQGVGVNYTSGATCDSTTYCNAGQPGNVLGACCAGSTCTATTQAGCAVTSQWQGLGTGVSGTACSPLTYCQSNSLLGACCSTGGTCTVTVAAGCLGPSVFAGVGTGYDSATSGTACTPTTFCNGLLGACCSATGTCSATTQVGCTGNATWQGAGIGVSGTACSPTTFCQDPSIMGACCSISGACTATTAAGCRGTNMFAGAGAGYVSGTACSPTTYCNTGTSSVLGPCCSAVTAACSLTSASGCISPNTFGTVGGACGTPPCPQAACCAANGTCSLVGPAGACSGTLLGTGTACTPTNPCGGACCNSSTFVCTVAANAAGCPSGNTFTNGGLCNPNPCYSSLPSVCEAFDTTTAGSLPAGWTTATSGAGALWTVVTTGPSPVPSAPNAVFTNDVSTASSQTLVLPTVTAAGNLAVSLFSNSTTETNWDGWVLEASVNGGAYTNVGTAAWIQNGYNGTLNSGSANPLTGQPAFTGTLATWTQRVAVVTANSGDSVSIRFNMGSDGSQSSTGVWLDNICIYNIQIGTGACCDPSGGCAVGPNNLCAAPSLFQGIGSACTAQNTCLGATSACCNNSTGACTFTNGTTCAAGSTSQGTVCSPSPCVTTATCCNNSTGACTAIYGGACASGSTLGTGTACGSGTPSSSCAAVGICCNSSSCACTVIYGGSCPSGTTTGTGTTCGTTSCPVSLICCNTTTFTCTTLCSGTCASGSVQGTGTSCSAQGSCPFGACCNTSCGGCTVGPSSACTTGAYAGDGSTCAAACPNAGYTVSASPATYTPGTTSTGNACDDCSTPITFPFPVTFYGIQYNAGNAGSNGWLDFTTAHASGFYSNVCMPAQRGTTDTAPASFGPVIMPLWDDQRTDTTPGPGAGIYTSTSGVAPNRTFTIEWRTYYFGTTGTSPTLNYEIIFYEGQSYFDVLYGTTFSDACSATVGVESDGANPGMAFSQLECNTAGGTTCTGQIPAGAKIRVECSGACCNGTVCSVSGASTCAGTFTVGASCSPTLCAPPAVCCRGATCNATVPQANCNVASGTAGSRFQVGPSTCNASATSNTPCCFADYNKTGGVSVQDIFDFLADWFNNSPYANTGGNGSPSALNVQNIFDFLSAWFAGGC